MLVSVNLFMYGSYSEVKWIIKRIGKPFIQLLEYPDTEILFKVLKGIMVILERGDLEEESLFIEYFLDKEGERLLDGVMSNSNKKIADKAQEIVKMYLERFTDFDLICPTEVADNQFNF